MGFTAEIFSTGLLQMKAYLSSPVLNLETIEQ